MNARLEARLDPPTPEGLNRSDRSAPQRWHAAVDSDAFYELLATKLRCVAPLLGFSFVFIITMTLLAGYAKTFMAQKVLGSFNLGYLLVVSTYVLCWVVSVIYVRTANRKFDAQASASIEAAKTGRAS